MTFYDMTWLERVLFLKRIKGGSSGHEETTTSNTFVTDMVAPLRKLLLSFAPKQSGSGDPSPTNVRPISGWDGVSVTRYGKNLWTDEYFSTESYPLTLITDTTSENYGFYGGSVASWADNNYARPYGLFDFPLNADRVTISATIKATSNTFTFRFFFIYSDGTSSYGSNKLASTTASRQSQTSTSGKTVVGAFISTSAGGSNVRGLIKDVQIEIGSSVTDLEPYAGQTYSVSWQTEAGTVYGGTLDMVSGVLTACPYYASYNGETLVGEWISDRDVYTPNTSPTTGAQVVNIGGTPTTYQLTPQQINTLIGTNNILTDAEVSEIVYLKKAE